MRIGELAPRVQIRLENLPKSIISEFQCQEAAVLTISFNTKFTILGLNSTRTHHTL